MFPDRRKRHHARVRAPSSGVRATMRVLNDVTMLPKRGGREHPADMVVPGFLPFCPREGWWQGGLHLGCVGPADINTLPTVAALHQGSHGRVASPGSSIPPRLSPRESFRCRPRWAVLAESMARQRPQRNQSSPWCRHLYALPVRMPLAFLK
jgi:hypothetical protein